MRPGRQSAFFPIALPRRLWKAAVPSEGHLCMCHLNSNEKDHCMPRLFTSEMTNYIIDSFEDMKPRKKSRKMYACFREIYNKEKWGAVAFTTNPTGQGRGFLFSAALTPFNVQCGLLIYYYYLITASCSRPGSPFPHGLIPST